MTIGELMSELVKYTPDVEVYIEINLSQMAVDVLKGCVSARIANVEFNRTVGKVVIGS